VRQPNILVGLTGAGALFCAGAFGAVDAGWGYALLLLAGALLVSASVVFGVLALSKRGDAGTLARWSGRGLLAGAWGYAWGVSALGGFFARETLQGRMQTHWIAFGLAALAALVVLDIGLYKRLVAYNQVSWRRYRAHLSRTDAEPAAMRRALIDEVLLHRTLHRTSSLRWWRHTLIFWGFGLMFLTELLAVVFREAVPAFGWRDIWRVPGHPLRAGFEFAFDFFGMMILLGCLLALIWRWRVNGTDAQKYSDTPTVLFLLIVVVSGFTLEAARIAAAPDTPNAWASFAGLAMAWAFGTMLPAGIQKPLWYAHAIGACLFIAYVPLGRMVHSCATPIGRLMNSQRQMLAAKKLGVLAGLMRQRTPSQ
jgi:nitrate reductase gamma subunit